MSTGGVRTFVSQVFLDGLTHDARYQYRFRMTQNQRNHWWANERALNPGRWFHYNGREEYRRDAVNNTVPLQFLLEAAMEIAHEAAFVARRAARLAVESTRNTTMAESAAGDRVSSSESSDGSDNESDSDSPEVIIINNSCSDSDSASDSD